MGICWYFCRCSSWVFVPFIRRLIATTRMLYLLKFWKRSVGTPDGRRYAAFVAMWFVFSRRPSSLAVLCFYPLQPTYCPRALANP